MTEILDNNTLQTWVNELKTFPNFINDLNPTAYQCNKLITYLNKLRSEADGEADTARYILNELKDPVRRPDMVGNIEAINRQRLLMLNYIKDSMIYSNIKTIVEDWKNKLAPPAKDQEPKPDNTFISHLVMDENKKQPFADRIKKQFPEIKGTKLGILLGAMEAKGWICIGTRTELYNSIRQFFGWNICSDAILNRVMSNLTCKTKELQQYQTIIENIYNSIV